MVKNGYNPQPAGAPTMEVVMEYVHPLRRFDLAMALLLRRESLMSGEVIEQLLWSEFRSVTVRTYIDVLAQHVRVWRKDFPSETWPQPEVDFARGTMTFWANARRFRIVLSWGGDGWELRSYGPLADRRDPLAHAVKWVVSGSILEVPRRVRDDLEQFSRVVATLAITGISPSDMVRLYEPVHARTSALNLVNVWSYIGCARTGDPLFARALAAPM